MSAPTPLPIKRTFPRVGFGVTAPGPFAWTCCIAEADGYLRRHGDRQL
ncbi:hypothetical protein IG631_04006 [Alternaria alternata]|nr:hypothetical protein IG631_04006 [Alternaria alternata]